MRTRGRSYQDPRLPDTEREYAEFCPRGCGSFLSEELQRGANHAFATVLFCVNDHCGWREWDLVDTCPDVQRLARQGCKPAEIAARLGLSERTVFRHLAATR